MSGGVHVHLPSTLVQYMGEDTYTSKYTGSETCQRKASMLIRMMNGDDDYEGDDDDGSGVLGM